MVQLKMNSVPSTTPTGFFAYASAPPSIPPTIRAAIESINKTQVVLITSWEELQVNGKYIIREICSAIEDADFFCADVTSINPNVMFEIGFAIARNKRIWLIRDDSYADPKKEFEQLRLLTTVGYTPYLNSEHIIRGFFKEQPHDTLQETIFKQSIEPILGPQTGPESLLYLKSRFDTEASVLVTRVVQDSRFTLTVDDPRESSVQPLYWYGQKLYNSFGAVAHFLSPARQGFRLHNARYALVCGLAHGFDVPNVMLSEDSDVLAPMDYRDALRDYTTPSEAARYVEEFLQAFSHDRKSSPEMKSAYVGALKLATELKDFHLQLGEFVAENESEHLNEYFVETTAYRDVINGTQTIFVGRKGTGKTASLIQAAHEIGKDVQNLVCVIKPVGYEIETLVRLFGNYKTRDTKGYVIESLWKFMLYTELARAAAQQIEESLLWQLTEPDARRFIDLLDEEHLRGDFTVRLERTISSLSKVNGEAGVELFRAGISEALHSGTISALRTALAEVLSKKRKVIVLVDNLDKPWTRSADLDQLAEFLLGLLSAGARVGDEMRRGDRQKQATRINVAIFLRSDIFNRVVGIAREPDKLSHTRLDWGDPELLLRIIEDRYIASHGPLSDPADMWHKYFCAKVRGLPTRAYLSRRILPRPRDIVYFVKAAVSLAVNKKRDRVEERDILEAEKQYSQYALDSILVENGITIPQLEAVLLEFLGSKAVLPAASVQEIVGRSGIAPEKIDKVVEHLIDLTFLGIEVSDGQFAYSDDPKELKKNTILAERVCAKKGHRLYQINPAFRAYLEVEETWAQIVAAT